MKVLAKNKRAKYDYEITDTMTAGLSLLGSEVKSIKQGSVSLRGSYIRFKNDRPYLSGAHVSPYESAAIQHDPERERALLLHKHEIKQLADARQNGRHIVPIAIGAQRGFVKLEIGVGRPRKKHDKRSRIKSRESERQMARAKNARH